MDPMLFRGPRSTNAQGSTRYWVPSRLAWEPTGRRTARPGLARGSIHTDGWSPGAPRRAANGLGASAGHREGTSASRSSCNGGATGAARLRWQLEAYKALRAYRHDMTCMYNTWMASMTLDQLTLLDLSTGLTYGVQPPVHLAPEHRARSGGVRHLPWLSGSPVVPQWNRCSLVEGRMHGLCRMHPAPGCLITRDPMSSLSRFSPIF
ncbi:hypothetical protein V8C44DRAFT_343184 [Trichoderma aethiopicum]